MATLVKPNQSRSFKYLYTRIAAVLTFAILVIAGPQIEEILETFPNPLPDTPKPANNVNTETYYQNTYYTNRDGVTLVEEIIDGTSHFTINDGTNYVIRSINQTQFNEIKNDWGAVDQSKNEETITSGELNLSDQAEKFEAIGFEPVGCEILSNSNTGNVNEVKFKLADNYIKGQNWEITLNGDGSEVMARLNDPETVLTMPLAQLNEMNETGFEKFCEG